MTMNNSSRENDTGLPNSTAMATHEPDSLFQQWLSLRDQINSHNDYASADCQALEAEQDQIEAAILARPCVTAVDLAERYMIESCLFTVDSDDFDRFCAELAGFEVSDRT